MTVAENIFSSFGIMKATEQYKIIVLILVILGVAFYWYEWRPSQIRMECSEIAKDKTTGLGATYERYENYYESCLREKGL